MPEYTPPLDTEALAKVAESAYAYAWEEIGMSGPAWQTVAFAICDQRDQDWQTALDARTTALRLARDSVTEAGDMLLSAMAVVGGRELEGLRGYIIAAGEAIDTTLATISAALGEGEQ